MAASHSSAVQSRPSSHAFAVPLHAPAPSQASAVVQRLASLQAVPAVSKVHVGLQQSPAVGRAIAELIAFGGYRSIDLSRFGWERVLASRPIFERNVV